MKKQNWSIIILALIVSAGTSYAVTLSLATASSPSMEVKALVEQEVQHQLSKNKVTLPYEISFFAAGNSLVTVYSKATLENLTIVYEYTSLDNGTTVTKSIDYGTFIPAWGAGTVIEAGAVPEGLYKIPDDIIRASSTTQFDIQPKVTVLEVYGYS